MIFFRKENNMLVIINAPSNDVLPNELQKSNFPHLFNTISTLKNLEITNDYLKENKNYPNLYQAYLTQFFSHFNNYKNAIIITNELDVLIKVLIVPFKMLNIEKNITLNEMEEKINEITNFKWS